MNDLTDALAETGATIAFDAIGGGKLAGQILTCMEAAINRDAKVYSRYGSNVHKQVYIYGGLEPGPVELNRAFGMTWGVGGWLLFSFLMKISADDRQRLRQRVAKRAQDDLRKPLYAGGFLIRGASAVASCGLCQARHR